MNTPLPIAWPSDGLIPAVIQDGESQDVLMVGFMNREALDRTRETGLVHFWSRSRQKLWLKGETSGHVQRVRDIFVNCELNSLLIEVEQVGAVCHDGYSTCYYRRLEPVNSLETIRDRWFDPEDVYGNASGLRAITELWWGAYEFLRDHDLAETSGTSRRVRDGATSLVPRIADELGELAGVLDGTHVHEGQQADLVLEASQACYWVACELVRRGVPYADVRPDRAMDVQPEDAPAAMTMAQLLRGASAKLDGTSLSAEEGHRLFSLVANAARSLGVAPITVIQNDLSDLRARAYLSPYFSR